MYCQNGSNIYNILYYIKYKRIRLYCFYSSLKNTDNLSIRREKILYQKIKNLPVHIRERIRFAPALPEFNSMSSNEISRAISQGSHPTSSFPFIENSSLGGLGVTARGHFASRPAYPRQASSSSIFNYLPNWLDFMDRRLASTCTPAIFRDSTKQEQARFP